LTCFSTSDHIAQSNPITATFFGLPVILLISSYIFDLISVCNLSAFS
jgi:hypothetical protein